MQNIKELIDYDKPGFIHPDEVIAHISRPPKDIDEQIELYTLDRDPSNSIVVTYAPFVWNPTGHEKILLLGLTPGFTQAHNAWKEALARANNKINAADKRIIASFSGSMRSTLCKYLEEIGIHDALKIKNANQLFKEASNYTATASCYYYPMFKRKGSDFANYSGGINPQTSQKYGKFLCAWIKAILPKILSDVPQALIIPLGGAVDKILVNAIADGYVEDSRCLHGFPHPSGANGHAKDYMARYGDQMRVKVNQFFAY